MPILLHDDAGISRVSLVVTFSTGEQWEFLNWTVPHSVGERSVASGAVGIIAEGLRVALARRARRVPARRWIVLVEFCDGLLDVFARVHIYIKRADIQYMSAFQIKQKVKEDVLTSSRSVECVVRCRFIRSCVVRCGRGSV